MADIQLETLTKRIENIIEFEGLAAEEVFEVLGDPRKITDWYLLAKQVHVDELQPEEFKVEFTFFGLVDEEILHWDPPVRYVYKAYGPDFPIKDYTAEIRIDMTDAKQGTLFWTIYYDVIEGEEFQRILPVMLPAVNEASMHKLSALIGGRSVRVTSY
jgi:hypothetical protein